MPDLLDNPNGTKRERTRDNLLAAAQALLWECNAADLRIRQITEHAGLVHASFYNYYPDVGALITDLGKLLGATHAVVMSQLVSGSDCPAVRFARITRQTLRIVAQQPYFGRLMFDVGLPIDRLASDLRQSLELDIVEGVSRGIFDAPDVEIASSMVSGAIRGLALDLHRGALSATKIEEATSRLLRSLGVAPAEAERLAFAPIDFVPALELPIRWLALPPAPQSLPPSSLGG
ncbi:MAG: hypothetical protein RLZZ08_1497 [Pseudomonadota bacterium]|jgi:AcrR family transcriptional regulator